MKHLFLIKLTAFLLGLCLLAPAGTVWGAQPPDQEAGEQRAEGGDGLLAPGPVTMDVVYGYQNTAKSGRFLPLEVTLDNQSEEEFSGTLAVISMEPDYQAYSSSTSSYEYDVYRYEYPVEIGGGETAVKNLSISLGLRMDQMYVSLLDRNGTELARKRLKLNLNMDTAELFVGVLSDSPDTLFYMNGMGIRYSTLRIRTIEVSREALPDNELGLDQLDALIITDFDTRQLTGGQREAIMSWVRNGGLLLLGTGARAADTLAAFEGELLEGPIPEPSLQQVNMGVEFAVNSPSDAEISLICAQAPLKDSEELLSSDELSVVSTVPEGNGQIAVTAYALGDIRDFCQGHPDYVDSLFTRLLGEERINELSSGANGATQRFWSVQNLVNTGDIGRLPRVGLYISLMTAYVLLVGPGLYFFLKHRELRQYYHVAVAALAVCTTGMVLLMGTAIRFRGPFFTYASIRDIDEGGETETLLVNMRTPYNRPYSVTVNSAYNVWPITGAPYYSGRTDLPEFTGEEEPAVSIHYGEDETRIACNGVGAFQSKFFCLERKEESGSGFSGAISLFDGKIGGTLTNDSGQALDHVAILFYNQLVVVGSMEPGETVKLDGLEVLYTVTNSGDIAAGRITGAFRYGQGGNVGDPSYAETMEQTNLLSFYINNYLSGYHTDARIVAFGRDRTERDFLDQDGLETYGMTLLTSPMAVDYQQDGRVYYSAMRREPKVISGEYYKSGNTMYGLSPVVLEYYLGSDIELDTLTLHWMTEELEQNLQYYYMVPFSGSLYFYNYDTGSYDAMNMERTEYSRQSLEPYLSPGNTLTVKYVYDGSEDYSWNIVLPVLTVTGRRK